MKKKSQAAWDGKRVRRIKGNVPVAVRQRPQLLRIRGLRVPGMRASDSGQCLPEAPGDEAAEARLLHEPVRPALGVHDAGPHHGDEPGADGVHGVDEAEDGGRHDGKRAGPVLPDDPLHPLPRAEQVEDGVVRRLGRTHHRHRMHLLQGVEVHPHVRGVDDGGPEVRRGPRWHDRVRRRTRRVDELRALEGGLALELEPPTASVGVAPAPREPLDAHHLGAQARAPHEVVVAREVVQVAVDGVAGDVAVGRDALLAHRVERVLEEAVLDLRVEARVELLGAPDAPDRRLVVQQHQARPRVQLQVRLRADEPIPACRMVSPLAPVDRLRGIRTGLGTFLDLTCADDYDVDSLGRHDC